jgi:hypothetical protein
VDLAGEVADSDLQAHLFGYLPAERLGVGLARLDPTARQGPQAAAGLVRPLNQQEAALRVPDDGADARDWGLEHAGIVRPPARGDQVGA